MKKVLSILLCAVLCLSFTACKSVKKQNEEAKSALMSVWNKESSFSIKNSYTEKTTEESFEKYRFPTVSSAYNAFVPWGYLFTDFDGDGIEEMLVVSAELKFFIILRYDAEAVRGYMLDRINLQSVKTDGTFSFGPFAGQDYDYKTVCRVSFEGDGYKLSYLALINDAKGEYLLNDKSAKKKEIEKYISEWDKNTTKVEWFFNKVEME